MKEVWNKVKQNMIGLFWKIVNEREKLTIDGVCGYNERAQFVGGKVINFSSYVALELLKDTADYEKGLEALKEIISMAAGMPMETWGILNGITGLRRLQLRGLLEREVEENTMEILKKSMDWRSFVAVEDNYALIDKPTNYYGVAFGIARYRELLGWEAEKYSELLLNCLMIHIKAYSGEYGYMDETNGNGRFDRYSILIPSEITALILATEMEEPELIRGMLNNSAHIFLKLANERGTGFSYGRSIGAYGDTAALEVLSAAAKVGGIFTKEEAELAYGYSLRVVKHMLDFWYDEEMKSINMWDKGRRTDSYRNKNRILGENLSLYMQLANALQLWTGDIKEEPKGWEKLLEKQNSCNFIRFAKSDYDRGLVIVRDRKNIWSLPFINGGEYYDRDPYLSVPRQNFVLEGVPGISHGDMLPRLMLEDGRSLIPAAYISSIETGGDLNQAGYEVRCKYDTLCLTGADKPMKAEGTSCETVYRFKEGIIEREDVITVSDDWRIEKIKMKFLTFSTGAEEKAGKVSFADGVVASMEAMGYDSCETVNIAEMEEVCRDGIYDTPHGRMNTECLWIKEKKSSNREIRVSWRLKMR